MVSIYKEVKKCIFIKVRLFFTSIKWGLKDSANDKDIYKLDQLINERASSGWEFVCHSYMPNVAAARSAILVTFRKEK